MISCDLTQWIQVVPGPMVGSQSLGHETRVQAPKSGNPQESSASFSFQKSFRKSDDSRGGIHDRPWYSNFVGFLLKVKILRDDAWNATDQPKTSEIIHFRSWEHPKKRPWLEILTFPFLWEETWISKLSKLQKRIYQYRRDARNNQNVNNFPSLTTPDLLEHVARHCREPCTATPRTEVQNREMFLGHDSALLANSMSHMLSFLGICHWSPFNSFQVSQTLFAGVLNPDSYEWSPSSVKVEIFVYRFMSLPFHQPQKLSMHGYPWLLPHKGRPWRHRLEPLVCESTDFPRPKPIHPRFVS